MTDTIGDTKRYPDLNPESLGPFSEESPEKVYNNFLITFGDYSIPEDRKSAGSNDETKGKKKEVPKGEKVSKNSKSKGSKSSKDSKDSSGGSKVSKASNPSKDSKPSGPSKSKKTKREPQKLEKAGKTQDMED
ncbi:unnamed protein product [Caenorhabditis nigoni]